MANYLTEDTKGWIRTLLKEGVLSQDFAANLGIKRRQLFNILGGFPVSRKVEEKLREFMAEKGVRLRITGTSLEDALQTRKEIIRYNNFIIRRFLPNPDEGKQQEIRNIIFEPSVSEPLLNLQNPPSFASSVAASSMFFPKSAEEKNTPRLVGQKLNHFLQLAVVVDFVWPGQNEPTLLTYSRRGHWFDYSHHRGNAILWNCSFLYNAYPEGKNIVAPMDEWMQIVKKEPARAESSFLEGNLCYLRRLLNHKLQLQDYNLTTITPIGILNIDMRNLGEKSSCRANATSFPRVHSCYTFRVSINLRTGDDLVREVEAIPTPGIRLCAKSLSEVTKVFLETDNLTSRVTSMELNWTAVNAMYHEPGKNLHGVGASFYPGIHIL